MIDTEEQKGINTSKMRQRFRRLSDWLGLSDSPTPSEAEQEDKQDGIDVTKPALGRRSSKKVIPGLPRPATFKRQLSERRDRLIPHEPSTIEPRDVSVERRRAVSVPQNFLSTTPHLPESPPPAFSSTQETSTTEREGITTEDEKQQPPEPVITEVASTDISPGSEDPPPPFTPWSDDGEYLSEAELEEELEKRWILNVSMHFRDRSDREKFFVTFAETPNRWRRLTISLDYRDAPPDSLERDLKELRYQREKSARIYEAVRDSLPEIQFFNTVTNLKLQTTDGRLHVHVTQDMNEIISFPPRLTIKHLDCPVYPEKAVEFDSHLSGFVYKVNVHGRVFIKKEIPGPDAVDEFLYEINALHALRDSKNVIQFGGVIVDDEGEFVKGLLINFASKGAMIDLLYEEKGRLTWSRRERWAYQIIRGLSEIHEAGFVQGDLTLSNVVIDDKDDAKIIDINRRGCPVGWEPPEMKGLIANNQKVAMYIGVKSDLYQLGMILWSLAMENDEPDMELGRGPLRFEGSSDDIPGWYRDVVRVCLNERPQDRVSAKELLGRFQEESKVVSDEMKTDGEVHVNREQQTPPPSEAHSSYTPPRGRTLHLDQPTWAEDIPPSTLTPPPISMIEEDPDEEEPQIISISPPTSRSPSPSPTISPKLPNYLPEEGSQPLPIPNIEPDKASTDAATTRIQPTDTTHHVKSSSTTSSERWEEIEIQGHPYLIRRSELENLKLEVDEEVDDGGHGREEEGGPVEEMQKKDGTGAAVEIGDVQEEQVQEQAETKTETERKREKEKEKDGTDRDSSSAVDDSPILIDRVSEQTD